MTSRSQSDIKALESGRLALVERLRTQMKTIEEAIAARVRQRVPDPLADESPALTAGLSSAVAAVVQYTLAVIEAGALPPGPLPEAAVEQVRRLARGGVEMKTVLCRYVAGSSLLQTFLLAGIDRLKLSEAARIALRDSVMDLQQSLLDRILALIAEEYAQELESEAGSREQRRAELVRAVLAGEDVSSAALGYDLDGTHLGLIATGPHAEGVLHGFAAGLGRELLKVSSGEQTVWGWLGGDGPITAADLVPLHTGAGSSAVYVAVGEPAPGVAGFRRTHRMAVAANLVACHRREPITRYADVALLALALQDDLATTWLRETRARPLDKGGHGESLRKTLRAYLDTEYNAVSAAKLARIDRRTVKEHVVKIERLLGCRISERPAELDMMLQLESLLADAPSDQRLAK